MPRRAAGIVVVALLLALESNSCGGGGKTCREVFGQDCGPDVEVTLLYVQDAGYNYGGAHITCAPTACSSTKTMPSAQYEYAVRPSLAQSSCDVRETSSTTRLIDCTLHPADGGGPCVVSTNNPDCTCRAAPAFAHTTSCDWTPALLTGQTH